VKYPTLEALADAFAEARATGTVYVDNDIVTLSESEGSDSFAMHPDDLIHEALDLLGIPNEHV
jgi:hypothetical protein